MKRTKVFAVAIAAIALAVQAFGIIPAASQKVSNPSGPFTYTIHNSTLRIGATPFDFDDQHTPGCANGTNDDEDFLGDTAQRQDSNIDFIGGDPQCTSATDDSEIQGGFQAVAPVLVTGTVAADGTWTVNPTTGVSFAPAYAWAKNPIGSGFVITIAIVGVTSGDLPPTWVGSINPITGVANMPMQLQVKITGSPIFSANCHIGDTSGANRLVALATSDDPDGIAYNSTPGQLGTLRMAAHSFRVPQASQCDSYLGQDIQGTLNSTFGLPTTDTDAGFTGDFPAGNKPLQAITASLAATPAVACRATALTATGSAIRPISSYAFDDTNDGSIEQSSLATTRSAIYPTSGPKTARVRVSDNQSDFADATTSFTVGPNLPPTAPNQNLARSAAGVPVNFTLGGTDPEGGAVTRTIIVSPVNGAVTGGPTNFTYTPAPGFTGTDVLTYKVSDDCADNTDTTGTVTFNVNRTPVANNQTVDTTQDIPVPVTLTGSDADGDPLTFSVATNPANGTLSGTAPNLLYTPNPGYFGLDPFTFNVNDGLNGSTTPGVLTVNVVKNTRPVATPQNLSTPEDTGLDITVSGTDADGDTLAYTVLTSTTNGALTGTAPNLHYQPNPNYHGGDSFTFQVNDGKGGLNTATVTIDVTSVNDVPVAHGQSFSLSVNTTKSFTADVSDGDGDALSFTPTTALAHGVLTGTFPNLTYVPDTGFIGDDTLVYDVSDGNGGTASATIVFHVTPTNQPPVAGSATVNTNEDTAKSFSLNASDPEGGAISIAIVQSPAHGSLSGTAPALTYTPNPDYNGPDTFKFTVTDDQDHVSTGTISINVLAVNDAPVATPQTVAATEDVNKTIILSSTDVDDTVITYSVTSTPAHGTVTGTAPNVTYVPVANYNGPDSFTFRARDPKGATTTATITINVAPVNDAPKATALAKTVVEDGTVAVTLAGTDVDNAVLTFSVVAAPTHGTLTGSAPNLTYKPNANYNGFESFTYKANDGSLDSAQATVTITVTAVNDVPVAAPQSVTTLEDTAKPVTLVATDPDPGTLTYRIEVAPAHGKLTGTAPNVTYTPTADYTGADSFKFSATDAQGTKGMAIIDISVTPAPMIATKVVAQPTVKKVGLLGGITFPNLKATLTRTDTNAGLAGRTIDFYVNGQNNVPVKVCSAVTNSAGLASCSGNGTNALLAANYYTANFAGDPDFAPSFGTAGVNG